MIDNKTVSLLKTFNKQQFSDLIHYISCPFFNKKKELIALCKYLEKYAPDFHDEQKLKKVVIYRKIFPGKLFNADKIQRTITAFTKLVEEFLAYCIFKSDGVNQKFALLKHYNQPSLYELFEKKQKEIQGLFDNDQLGNDSNYFQFYRLSLERFNYFAINNSFDRSKELKLAMHTFQIFYLISKLKLLCHFFNQKNITKYEEDFILTDEYGDNIAVIEAIIEQAKTERFASTLLVKVFYHTLLFLKDPNQEEDFQIVKSLLIDGALSKQVLEEKLIYDFTSNYCALRVNAGDKKYYKEMFELLQLALEKGILYIDQYLFPATVKNIVTIGLRLGELDWIEDFLQNYKEEIHPNNREEVLQYNKAHLCFYQKKYDQALNYLNEAALKDVFFKKDADKLRAMIYYEQDQVRLLDSYIERVYMANYRDTLLSQKHIDSNKNFINLLKQLLHISPGNEQKLQRLLLKVEKTEKVANRPWLQEKIKEKLYPVRSR